MQIYVQRRIKSFLLESCCILLILFASIANAGENLFKNSSFELGLCSIAGAGKLHLTQNNSFHGNSHATIKIGKNSRIYFTSKQLKELPSVYTFSAYLKSDTKPVDIKLGFMDDNWGFIGSKRFSVGEYWERYSFTGIIEPYISKHGKIQKNIYIPTIIARGQGAVLHIDALQLEKAELTNFYQKNDIEFGAWTEKYGNVFLENEPLKFNVGVQNNTISTCNFLLNILIKDFYGKTLFVNHRPIKIDPEESTIFHFDIPVNQLGLLKIFLKVDNAGSEKKEYILPVAKIKSVQKRFNYSLHSNFGIHVSSALFSDDPIIENKRWDILNQSGAQWIRVFFSWKRVEWKKGDLNWKYYDRVMNLAEKYKFKVLGVMSNKTPPWFKSSTDPLDNTTFFSFCTAAVKRYPKIGVWEVFNEPYWKYSTSYKPLTLKQSSFFRHYQNFHKKLYKYIKVIDSNKTVLLNGTGLFQQKQQMRFLKDSSNEKNKLLQYCDGISLHLYPGFYPGKETDRFKQTKLLISDIIEEAERPELDIWQTEMGISSDDMADFDNNPYGQFNLHMKKNAFGYGPEIECARSMIKYSILLLSNKVKTTFCFEAGNNYPSFSLLSMFRNRWTSPKAIFPAFNILTNLLDEAEFIETVHLTNFNIYIFKRGGQGIIVTWQNKNVNSKKQFIVSGVAGIIVKDMMGNKISCGSRASGHIVSARDLDPLYILFDYSTFGNLQLLPILKK
ncbi:MAG: beta-galactosidase [Bacteroidales bacterium]|nr:beta-galactosidase [Bacteroidales bacterium]